MNTLLICVCLLIPLVGHVSTEGATCKTRDLSDEASSGGTSASGPRFSIKPPAEIKARIGERLTVPCEGFFGEGDDLTRNVFWLANGKFVGPSSKYNTSEYRCLGSQYIGLTITIPSVGQAEFNVTLTCLLNSNRRNNDKLNTTVTIKPYPPPEERDVGVWVAVGVSVSLLLLLALAVVCYLLWWPRIAYCCHTTCRRSGDIGDCGIAVIHDETNSFAEDQLYSFIKDLSYPKLQIMGVDLSGDMPSFTGGQEMISGCRYAVFVVTPGPQVALFTHLLRNAVAQGREIILVEAHPQGKKHSTWSPPGNYLDQNTDFLSKRKIRWLGDQLTERQKTNFLCEIGRRLPPAPKRKDGNGTVYIAANGHGDKTSPV